MANKAPWGIVVLLGIVCLAEAGYIMHRAAGSTPPGGAATLPPGENLDHWKNRLHEEIARTGKLVDKDFDQLFGDDFFRQRFDPFAEIDRAHRQLEKSFAGSERALFDSSFQDWFSKRMDLAGITTKIAEQGKDVTVTFGIPDLKENSAKFDVNANRIRFRYDTRKDVKKGASDVETTESVEKIVPLPDGADPNGFEVRKGKDEITLVFHGIAHAA